MTVMDLTGRERARIIIGALRKMNADDIARMVHVPVEIVRELCGIVEIKLEERTEK